mmetsp:Transcript_75244/g.147682  ORF Transcript_75244/g.147682 Transcript_75244/m.147682 type:complete len:223 (-) Transcript_75244:36-704(-)
MCEGKPRLHRDRRQRWRSPLLAPHHPRAAHDIHEPPKTGRGLAHRPGLAERRPLRQRGQASRFLRPEAEQTLCAAFFAAQQHHGAVPTQGQGQRGRLQLARWQDPLLGCRLRRPDGLPRVSPRRDIEIALRRGVSVGPVHRRGRGGCDVVHLRPRELPLHPAVRRALRRGDESSLEPGPEAARHRREGRLRRRLELLRGLMRRLPGARGRELAVAHGRDSAA